MGSAAWASVAVAALALAFTAVTWMLTRAMRRATVSAVTAERLSRMARDIEELRRAGDRRDTELRAELRADRQATDERLRWLEQTMLRLHTPGSPT